MTNWLKDLANQVDFCTLLIDELRVEEGNSRNFLNSAFGDQNKFSVARVNQLLKKVS
ncbi:MAG: hypothetical protein ACRESZ_14790 [Methylococcales bacterium]